MNNMFVRNLMKNGLFNKGKKKKKGGFTLIELVAVLAIIGILSAALTPKIGGYINEAKKAGVLNEAKTIVTAYESISFKDNKLDGNSPISKIIDAAGDLIEKDSITKIPTTFTLIQCKNILDTENYNFTYDGKVVTKIDKVGTSTTP